MRLTNSFREEVLESEINKKFKDKFNKLEQKISVEAERLARKAIPTIDQKLIDDGYIRTTSSFEVEGHGPIYSTNRSYSSRIKLANPVPSKTYCSDGKIIASKTLLKLIKQADDVRMEYFDFKRKLNQALRSFNTKKQLLEVLPELECHFPKDTVSKSETAIIPVQMIQDVRKMLER